MPRRLTQAHGRRWDSAWLRLPLQSAVGVVCNHKSLHRKAFGNVFLLPRSLTLGATLELVRIFCVFQVTP